MYHEHVSRLEMPAEEAHHHELRIESTSDHLGVDASDRPIVRPLDDQVLREIESEEEALPDEEFAAEADRRSTAKGADLVRRRRRVEIHHISGPAELSVRENLQVLPLPLRPREIGKRCLGEEGEIDRVLTCGFGREGKCGICANSCAAVADIAGCRRIVDLQHRADPIIYIPSERQAEREIEHAIEFLARDHVSILRHLHHADVGGEIWTFMPALLREIGGCDLSGFGGLL